MRVNVYAEEMTDRIEIVSKWIAGEVFTGVRFYLYLPVASGDGIEVRGPFKHSPLDDDSAAVTFWGKRDLKKTLLRALQLLEQSDHPLPVAQGAPAGQANSVANAVTDGARDRASRS